MAQSVLDLPSQEIPTAEIAIQRSYQHAVDEWFRHYRESYGADPTWGSKQGAQLNRLIKAHSADEVIRRLAILFASPPSWLKPPFDFSTLVQHFDKLVSPSTNGIGEIRSIPEL